MKNKGYNLAIYLDELWEKGFKLKDDQIRFIYFGKQYTGAVDFWVIVAVSATIRIKYQFDGSYYMAILELFSQEKPKTKKQAWRILEKRGVLPTKQNKIRNG
ncbi:DUF6123 family protein [Bacillaceae bacterium S4-13-56]